MECIVLRNKISGKYAYAEKTYKLKADQEFITDCKSEKDANAICDKLNATLTGPITIADFYIRSNVEWRDEFEKYVRVHTQVEPFDIKNFTYDEWETIYKDFAEGNSLVLWCPFNSPDLFTTFNFLVYEFVQDGFYNYFEYGENFDERDWFFVKAFRNRGDARAFVKEHNDKKRKQIAEFVDSFEPSKVSETKVKSEKTFDWKEAMKALIDGKRVEARVCIPGLPESENGWFEVEFAISPEDKEFGEIIKLGKDWDYRILDDSKERKELFDECEKLGIINVSKVSKVSTSLLRDIVDAVKSVDLDWEGIAKQINEETE